MRLLHFNSLLASPTIQQQLLKMEGRTIVLAMFRMINVLKSRRL